MIQRLIQNIPLDKKEHLILGVFLGFPFVLLFGNIGCFIALIGFAAKEIVLDGWMKKGTPEFLDFLYSAIPVIQYFILINYIDFNGIFDLTKLFN